MREAFEQSIHDEPAEALNRFAYADWLEDQGQYARAEFIRLGVRINQSVPQDPRSLPLRERYVDLLRKHGQEWFPTPQKMPANYFLTYTNGVPEIYTFPPALEHERRRDYLTRIHQELQKWFEDLRPIDLAIGGNLAGSLNAAELSIGEDERCNISSLNFSRVTAINTELISAITGDTDLEEKAASNLIYLQPSQEGLSRENVANLIYKSLPHFKHLEFSKEAHIRQFFDNVMESNAGNWLMQKKEFDHGLPALQTINGEDARDVACRYLPSTTVKTNEVLRHAGSTRHDL